MNVKNMKSPILTFISRTLALVVLVGGLSIGSVQAQDYKEAYNAAVEAAKAKNYKVAYTKYEEAARGAKQAGDQDVATMSNKVLTQLDKIYGNRALKDEKFEEAKGHFEKGIAHDPSHAYNHYGLGLALKNMGDMDGAIAAWKKAMEAGASSTDAKDREAARTAEQALSDNLYYEASSRLAKNGVSSSDADAAITALNKAKEHLDPNADWHFYMGLALRAKGQSQQAIAELDQALEMHRGSAADKSKIHFALAEIYLEEGNNEAAKQHFSQCVGQYKQSAQDAIERYNL